MKKSTPTREQPLQSCTNKSQPHHDAQRPPHPAGPHSPTGIPIPALGCALVFPHSSCVEALEYWFALLILPECILQTTSDKVGLVSRAELEATIVGRCVGIRPRRTVCRHSVDVSVAACVHYGAVGSSNWYCTCSEGGGRAWDLDGVARHGA